MQYFCPMGSTPRLFHDLFVLIPVESEGDVLTIRSVHNYINECGVATERWTQIDVVFFDETDFDGKVNVNIGRRFDPILQFEQHFCGFLSLNTQRVRTDIPFKLKVEYLGIDHSLTCCLKRHSKLNTSWLTSIISSGREYCNQNQILLIYGTKGCQWVLSQ